MELKNFLVSRLETLIVIIAIIGGLILLKGIDKMDEMVITVLRKTRTALQVLYEPIDALTRFVNYKKGYPPLWIRQKVGSLNDFEGSGGEYMAYLKLLCGLQPGMSVLDIGCGCGLMCLPLNENPTLPEYIYPGSYIGVDIDKTQIDWCKRYLMDMGNVSFGTSIQELPKGVFDVVLCKSLFTHLYLGEAEEYLQWIKEGLKPSGVCLATFFLYRDTDKLVGRYRFKHPSVNGHVFYERASKPRLAVAYDAELFPSMKALEGLVIDNIHYGSWRGDNKGLSFQDIVILRR